MKPLTYYCDAAGPIAERFGDYLEALNEEQVVDLIESIAHFLKTGSIASTWKPYFDRSWSVADLKKLILGAAAVFCERPDPEYTADYEPVDDDDENPDMF